MKSAACLFVLASLVVTRLPVLPEIAPLFVALPVAIFGLSRPGILPLSAFFLGLLYVLAQATSGIGAAFPDELQGHDLWVTGQVTGLPAEKDGIVRFRFNIQSMADCEFCWTGLTTISWYHAPVRVRPGDRFKLNVRLSKPGASLNPGLFDYEGWLFAQGIAASGYVRAGEAFKRLEYQPWTTPHHALRYQIRESMERFLQGSSVKGLLVALVIGETGQISRTHWNSLTSTGTNHLLIISGLHVGLVAAMVFRVLSFAPLSIRTTGLISIILTACYAAIAGFGLPVQRALMMTTIVIAAVCINRKVSVLNMFTASLLGVILLQPFAVMSSGFWLSFGAVFALLYAFGGRQLQHEFGAARQIVIASIRTQWVVTVAMFPLLLYLLYQNSLVALIVNLVAIPWVSLLVIPWLLLFVVTLPLSTIVAVGSLSVAEFSLSLLWQGIEWMAAKNWMYYNAPGLEELLLALSGLLIIFSPRGLLPRWPGWMCLLPLLTLAPVPKTGETRVTFIDVGQGLSVLIQTRHSALLYDAGPKFGNRFDSGEQIITPLLRKLGVRDLQTLVISHGDNDHAGGKRAILKNFRVHRVISSVTGSLQNCTSDIRWSVDGIHFEIFSLASDSGNNGSCLLLLRGQGYAMLITGDIEEVSEDNLLQRKLPGIRVISVPHHGSRTSSSPGFINHLHPELAIVSAGFHNRFNHPDPVVLRRYASRHVRVLNTAREGAITIWLGDQGIERIERTRSESKRFFHRR